MILRSLGGAKESKEVAVTYWSALLPKFIWHSTEAIQRNATFISPSLFFIQPCSINFANERIINIELVLCMCVWGNLCPHSYSTSVFQKGKLISFFVLDFLSLTLLSTLDLSARCHSVYLLPQKNNLAFPKTTKALVASGAWDSETRS